MPDAYRAAPPRRAPHVIETRSILPRTLLSVWVVATVVLVALSQRVVITCVREPGGGVCSFRSERLFWSSDWKRVPIAEVERARVEEGDGTSRVTLVTKRGEVPLVSVLESGLSGEKAEVADAVNRFLPAPEAPRLIAAYGGGGLRAAGGAASARRSSSQALSLLRAARRCASVVLLCSWATKAQL